MLKRRIRKRQVNQTRGREMKSKGKLNEAIIFQCLEEMWIMHPGGFEGGSLGWLVLINDHAVQ